MNYVVILVVLALAMGGAGLAAFLWSLSAHQYDDLDGDAVRILNDDEDRPALPKPDQRS